MTIPQRWQKVRFADVFDFKGGSQPPKSEFASEARAGYIRLLQIRDFESDKKAVYIKDHDKWPKCREHDIMIGRYGASVGKVLGGKAGAYNVALVRLIFDPEQIDRGWARHFCASPFFQAPLKNISRSAQNGFNKEDLADIELPLPPPDEQRCIAITLDQLLGRSFSVREDLARIPRLVERHKQAVLSAAFQGSLTHDETTEWPSIPLSDIITRIDSGKNLRCEERPPTPGERGIVKVSSVTWGRFDPLASKTPSADTTLDPSSLIRTGDFLISRANTLELVGACVLVGVLSHSNLYLSDKVLRIKFSQPVEAWVLQFLRSRAGRTQIESLATGNQLSMRNISQAAIKAIRIPLPPEKVRTRILNEIARALNASEGALRETSRAKGLLDRLEQATLAKAFRGELTTPSAPKR